MEPTAVLTALSVRGLTGGPHSALPDAPVVITAERAAPAMRTRAAVARGLRRLAEVVAPPRPAACAD